MSCLEESNEIQHALDDQIRMREGAMKLMSACSTLNQALETSKNLLTINARILGLMSGLQRKKKQHVLEEYNRQRSSVCMDVLADCCTGRIAMSDIRVPLMWKDNVHFTGKTGDQSYYAFALIRCGDQVRDTSLCEITSADTDMYFAETLIFEDLLPDYVMEFEVYYTVITSHEAHPILNKPRASISIRSSSRRQVHFNAPKFCLAGHVQLCVDDVRGCMISKDLTMGAKGASGVAVLGDMTELPIHPLELWGQICCEVAAQPQCMLKKTLTCCQVKVEEDSWCEYFAELFQCKVQCWKDSCPADKSIVDKVIQLNEDVEVSVPDTGGGTDLLKLTIKDEILHTLQFLNDEDAIKWKYALRKEILNLRMWKAACKELMYIEEYRKSRISTPSNASFYEQIDIGDEPLIRPERSMSNGGTKDPFLLQDDDKHSEKCDDVFDTSTTTSLLNVPSVPAAHVPPEQDIVISFPETSEILSTKEKEAISLGIPAATVSSSDDITTSKSDDVIANNEGIDEDSSLPDVFVTSPKSDEVSSVVCDAKVLHTSNEEEDDDVEKIVYQKIHSMINDITENESKNHQYKETSNEINGELSEHDANTTNVDHVDVANDSTTLIANESGHIDDACGINVSTDTSVGKTDISDNDASNHDNDPNSNNCTEITNQTYNISNDTDPIVDSDIGSENTDIIIDTTITPCSYVGNVTNETETIDSNTDSITDNNYGIRNQSDPTSDNTNAARNTIDNITNTENDNDNTCVLSNNADDVSDNTNVASNHIGITEIHNNTDSITDNKNTSANADDTNRNTDEASNRVDNDTVEIDHTNKDTNVVSDNKDIISDTITVEVDHINKDTNVVSDNKDIIRDTISDIINTIEPDSNNIDNITSEINTDVIEDITDTISSSTDEISENTNAVVKDMNIIGETDTISNNAEVATDNNTNISTNTYETSDTTSAVSKIIDGTDTITSNTNDIGNTDIIDHDNTNAVSNNADAGGDNTYVVSSDVTDVNNNVTADKTESIGDNTVTSTNNTLVSSDNVHAIKDNTDIIHTSGDKLGDIINNTIALHDDTATADVNVIRDGPDDIDDTSVVISDHSVAVSDNSVIVTDNSDCISDNPDVFDNKVDSGAGNTNDSSNRSDVDNTCIVVVDQDVIRDDADTNDNSCDTIDTVIDPDKGDDSDQTNRKDISTSEDEKLHRDEQEIGINVEKVVEDEAIYIEASNGS